MILSDLIKTDYLFKEEGKTLSDGEEENLRKTLDKGRAWRHGWGADAGIPTFLKD